jgi:hypothetical protein
MSTSLTTCDNRDEDPVTLKSLTFSHSHVSPILISDNSRSGHSLYTSILNGCTSRSYDDTSLYQEKMKEETHSWGIVLTAGWVAAAASTMHQQAETKQRRGQ